MQEDNHGIKGKTEVKYRNILQNVKTSPVFRQVLVAVGPIFITGIVGVNDGYAAIMLPQLQHDNSTIEINEEISSLIASIPCLLAAFGCVLGGYLMEKIGRRFVHICSCIIISLGWVLIATTPNISLLLVGRSLCGFGDGVLAPATSVYVSETTQPNVRGVLLMSTTVALTVGILFVHLLSACVNWRTSAVVSGILPVPLAILMLLMPESPTFLIKKGKQEEAMCAFQWCRGSSDESREEFEEMIKRQLELNSCPKKPLWECVRNLAEPDFWKPFLVLSIMSLTDELSGENVVLSYTIQIVQDCGLNDEFFVMITVDLVRVASAISSCFLINKMPRRSLVMTSGFGAALSLLLLGCYLYIAPKYQIKLQVLVVVLLVTYLYFVYIGLNPLVWTLMGELYPVSNRGLGSAGSSAVDFILMYMVVFSFPYLETSFSSVFLCSSVTVLFGTSFLAIFLPETKNKSLSDIEKYFKSQK